METLASSPALFLFVPALVMPSITTEHSGGLTLEPSADSGNPNSILPLNVNAVSTGVNASPANAGDTSGTKPAAIRITNRISTA